ncbi:hypothetical protein [Microbispora catharanthi]|uniref:Tyr recombinase domain-containing protein n=1 Tax=Microbispora catharanthi TaxID=1712871 RepID=A0A5N6B0Z1_9ACTN|nr:hypothetical protein [Microbispora catharanthi]KAB8174494.1 hypothetical protein FH610_040395 [Microbispora catharanthi]
MPHVPVLRGAGEEKPVERPVLTVAQVFERAGLVAVRLRASILLAAFASLRWGEVAALWRMDLYLNAGTVSVRQLIWAKRSSGRTGLVQEGESSVFGRNRRRPAAG